MTQEPDERQGGRDDAAPAPDADVPGTAAASRGAIRDTAVIHHLLVENVRDYAIFALDPTGRVLTWNAGAERIKGWTADEAIGRHFSIFYPPEDIAAEKPARELREALRRGSVEDEGWRLRSDGSRFWANVVITPLYDAGSLIGFAKVTRDLTERREAQEQLRRSDERFRLIVQSVKDYAIFMLDPDGRIVTWNEGAQRIKGYTADEVIGRHFSIFYPENVRAVGFPEYELRVAASTGRFEDEGWRLRRDGSRFWASVVITSLIDPDGRPVGFAKVTRDLTERQAAQQRALDDARRVAEVEAASRAKSEFLATLSHELRTPLNAIGGYSELLAMGMAGELTGRQDEYVQRIRVSQQHLLGLVNDLLSLSRLEAGRIEVDVEPIPVDGLLRELEAMIAPELRVRRVELVVESCPAEATAHGDLVRTRQILINLLSNAVKFTPAGGRVGLSCTCADGAVRISVKDDGPGIPEDKQDTIFEPFVQLGRSLTDTKEGIGLGLAISRRLARAMSGELSVVSRPGTGATFTLMLPGAPADRTPG